MTGRVFGFGKKKEAEERNRRREEAKKSRGSKASRKSRRGSRGSIADIVLGEAKENPGGRRQSKLDNAIGRMSAKVGVPRHSLGKPRYSIACDLQHPCYVVPLDVVLNMTKMEPGDVLKRYDPPRCRPYNPAIDGEIVFLSHQWVANSHPDPHMQQFKVFQSVIRQLLNGGKVRPSYVHFIRFGDSTVLGGWKQRLKNAVVWYDYFCIPGQLGCRMDDHEDEEDPDAFMNAVNSIPAYVEMARTFFILAPLVGHADKTTDEGHPLMLDFPSWKSRGWCRAEAICRLLSCGIGPVVLIESEKRYQRATLMDQFYMPVGEAQLACCAFNHVIGGESIPCDRTAIAQFLGQLVEKLIKKLSIGENRAAYHFIRSMWRFVFHKLDTPEINLPELDLTEKRPFPPLFYAVLDCDFTEIKRLVNSKADVNQPLFGIIDGGITGITFQTPTGYNLFTISLLSIRKEEDWPILDYLLEVKCDPDHRMPAASVPWDNLPWTMAMSSLNDSAVEWWLKKLPTGQKERCLPFWLILSQFCPDMIYKIGKYRGVNCNWYSAFTGHSLFMLPLSSPRAVHPQVWENLVDYGWATYAHMRAVQTTRKCCAKDMRRFIMPLCRWLYRRGNRHPIVVWLAYVQDRNILLEATEKGNLPIVRYCLEKVEMDINAKNKLGFDALRLSREMGWVEIENLLLRAKNPRFSMLKYLKEEKDGRGPVETEFVTESRRCSVNVMGV